jgi:hypothetical protein
MCRIVIDNESNTADELQVFQHEDVMENVGIRFAFDLKGQPKIINFDLSRDDAKKLIKEMIDILF